MHELAPLIYDLALMLGIAGIVTLTFQRIKQPVVLGYLVAGMIIGPYTPPHALIKDVENIKILSELGIIFLMFSLGLEFSFQKLVRVGFSASVTGLLEVVLMVAVGYGAGMLLGWTYYDSLFLGAALSISSTTIIIKAIDELKLKTKRFAELIFGVLIVEDLLAILLLVGLSTVVVTQDIFSMDMLQAVIRLIIVVGGWFLIGYFVVPPIFSRFSNYISEETLTIISVALCLMLVCVAAYFHYSAALGAFIMGSILAETTLIHRIETLVMPIRDIFAAVFFISVGMLIDPAVIVDNWQAVLVISLVTVFGKTIITSMAAFLTGQSLNTSVRVGFGMAQVGEFSFIIAGLGITLGVTTAKLYPLIVAVSGITTFTTPYMIRFSGFVSKKIESSLPVKVIMFLENYSSWAYRAQTLSKGGEFFRKVSVRFIMNAIVVAIIFSFVHYGVLHRFGTMKWASHAESIMFLSLSLAVSSPFIWGMLFAYKVVDMPEYATSKFNPAVFLIWLLTLLELAILAIAYYNAWFTLTIVALSSIIFIAIAYRHLEASYHWFERQLISNISLKEHASSKRYHQLAPWETHLVEIEVGDKSKYVGKTLAQGKIREKFDVNIVAIRHGERVIPAPRGDEMIMANDRLIVLGEDAQIETFKQAIEVVNKDMTANDFLSHFSLEAVLMTKKHSMVGKSIRESNIRERIKGIVVGLERDHVRILNPVPDTLLQENDIVYIVGDTLGINKLKH